MLMAARRAQAARRSDNDSRRSPSTRRDKRKGARGTYTGSVGLPMWRQRVAMSYRSRQASGWAPSGVTLGLCVRAQVGMCVWGGGMGWCNYGVGVVSHQMLLRCCDSEAQQPSPYHGLAE
jgi:hypothetical protein